MRCQKDFVRVRVRGTSGLALRGRRFWVEAGRKCDRGIVSVAGIAMAITFAALHQTGILFQNTEDNTIYSSCAFTMPEALIKRPRAPG